MMKTAMADGGNKHEEYFYKLLFERMDRQDENIDKVLSHLDSMKVHVDSMRERVNTMENRTAPTRRKDLPEAWRDPKVLQIVFFLSLAVLLIVAYFLNYDLKEIL